VSHPAPARGDRRRLFFASFAMLFVELALIRWIAAYVVYVAYFTNFVLLASFLGVGVGFLRSRAGRNLAAWGPLAIAGVSAFALVFQASVSLRSNGVRTVDGLFGLPALPLWLELSLLFLGVTLAMTLVAERVGRLLDRFSPLEAYQLDVVGSLAGIAVFSVLSFVHVGPVGWGVVATLAFVLAAEVPARKLALAGGLALVAVGVPGLFVGTDTWSPYYRVSVAPADPLGHISIRVNGLPHQSILPLHELELRQPFYLQPYEHLSGERPGRVLIVGAGNGNDVAVALSKGAEHVDAVEIDPVLLSTGRARHPEHPYQDARVRAILDDGRAYLERSDQTYDLILFALPDSLTLVTGQGSLRLESYLFTREAMASVRDHLAPGGAFAMYNYYRPLVFERYANTMSVVFGHEPCFDPGREVLGSRRQAVLTIGLTTNDIRCTTPWRPATVVPDPAVDDHPFPYLAGRTIPPFYLVTLGLILLASAVVVRVAGRAGPGAIRRHADLFFMGAAFLLLETKNVVQFALLFGTTWFVNSLVFAGILLAVLGAVAAARRFRLPPVRVLYAVLAACLLAAWLVPPGLLLDLSPAPRFAAAAALAFAPVFAANLIFASRFRDASWSSTALGANLLGAMVGGVLEYGAIVVGYRNLLVLVAILYLAAFVTGRGSEPDHSKVTDRRLVGAHG
jgi:SAM-dependent methyltransferase